MAFTEYRIAVGHNVPLVNMPLIEDILWPYTKPRRIAPRSQPPDLFPIRTTLGSGRVRGDGAAQAAFEFTAIPVAAVNYLLHTYLFPGGLVSAAVTVLVRLHDANTHSRFNAYAILPVPGQDMAYIRQNVMNMILRFNDLVAL